MAIFNRRRQATMPSEPPDPYNLDQPLLTLSSKGDTWTIRDAFEGVQIFGATGSGKTSGSGAAIATGFLSHGFGGLVCCAQPGERELWEDYARATGREDDLIIFAPENDWRFNFLNYELKRQSRGGGQVENLVELFAIIHDTTKGKADQSTSESFWTDAMKELLRSVLIVLSLSSQALTLDEVAALIADAPENRDQAKDEKWLQTSFCAFCLAEAEKKVSAAGRHDLNTARRYILNTYAILGDRTRGSVVATFTSAASILNSGIAWELLGTGTNIVPELTFWEPDPKKGGAIIVLDLPIHQFHATGRLVQGIFKYMFQRAILAREVKKHPRPVFLWADEAQNFISHYDYQYQSEVRKHRGATVYLTQNISNYYAVLGPSGRDDANSLLGNLQTQIFHANGDQPTNEYAANRIGQQWTITRSFNAGRTDTGTSTGGGGGETVQLKVLPSAFTTLRKGGPDNDREVDAIIFQGGRVWQASRDTYLPTTFKQANL